MKRSGVDVFFLEEICHIMPGGVDVDELRGYILLHHGEALKFCQYGRNGVAIPLGKALARAWEAGGSVHQKGFNGCYRLIFRCRMTMRS